MEKETNFKDSKFLVMGGGSLYERIESYDPKDFIYSDYCFSELTEDIFGIGVYDDEYEELKQKILGFSD